LRVDFTDLLRSRAASFWRLRLIWDLMFATKKSLDQVCAVNTESVAAHGYTPPVGARRTRLPTS
jgi:hypothetical protein